MPKRTKATLASFRIRFRRVLWDLTRLHPAYRADVEELQREWKAIVDRFCEAINVRGFAVEPSQYWESSVAMNALRFVNDLGLCAAEIAGLPIDMEPKALDQSLTLHCERMTDVYRTAKAVRWGLPVKGKQIDFLPQLKRFEKRWHLPFPLPPSLEIPTTLSFAELAPPLDPIEQIELTTDRWVVRIRTVIGRELIIKLLHSEFSEIQAAWRYSPTIACRRKTSPVPELSQPEVEKESNGTFIVTVLLPSSPALLRSVLSEVLPPAAIRLREIESVLIAGRLKSQGERLTEIGKALRPDLDGDPSRILARDRLRSFMSLQERMTGVPRPKSS